MDENKILMTIAARKIVPRLRCKRVQVTDVLMHDPELGLFAVRVECQEWSGHRTSKFYAATYKNKSGFLLCCGVMPIPRKEVG